MTAVAFLGYDVGGADPFNRRYTLERIPDSVLASATVSDGWGTTDDTATVVLTDEPGVARYFHADILAVVLETPDGTRRWYGPLDVKDIDDQNAIGEYTITALADRWIERTVFRDLDTLDGQVAAILDLPMYVGWLSPDTKDTIRLRLRNTFDSAKSLSDLRTGLGKYSFTVVPDETVSRVSGHVLERERRVKAAALVPLTTVWTRGADDGAGGVEYLGVDFEPAPRLGISRFYTVLGRRRRDYTRQTLRATRVHVADRYNAPGTWAERQISVGFRVPAQGFNDRMVYPKDADGNPPAVSGALFPLELELIAANRALGGWALNAARRELQHSAARANLIIPEGDLTLSPNNILALDTPALPKFGTGEWRVVTADHATIGEAIETRLEVVLWQGESTDPAQFPRSLDILPDGG